MLKCWLQQQVLVEVQVPRAEGGEGERVAALPPVGPRGSRRERGEVAAPGGQQRRLEGWRRGRKGEGGGKSRAGAGSEQGQGFLPKSGVGGQAAAPQTPPSSHLGAGLVPAHLFSPNSHSACGVAHRGPCRRGPEQGCGLLKVTQRGQGQHSLGSQDAGCPGAGGTGHRMEAETSSNADVRRGQRVRLGRPPLGELHLPPGELGEAGTSPGIPE